VSPEDKYFLEEKLAPLAHSLGVRSESLIFSFGGVEFSGEFVFGFLIFSLPYLQLSLSNLRTSLIKTTVEEF